MLHRPPSPVPIEALPEAFQSTSPPTSSGFPVQQQTPSAQSSSSSTHYDAPQYQTFDAHASEAAASSSGVRHYLPHQQPLEDADVNMTDLSRGQRSSDRVPPPPYSGQSHAGPSSVNDKVNSSSSSSVTNALTTFSSLPEVMQDGQASPFKPHPKHERPSSRVQGFGVANSPGGDCRRICLRHQRMVDGQARVDLQKRLETLAPAEQQMANNIWSLFSSSSGAARITALRGLLTMCCPSQLSFLTEQLKAECRLDPFAVLPRELSLKCMGYLDAISLGRAAQVSKSWKALADDDLLWRTMCEQHIERKCEKCGWGLPLLERRRKQKSPNTAATMVHPSTALSTAATSSSSLAAASASSSSASLLNPSASQSLAAQVQQNYENAKHNHTPLPKSLEEALSRAAASAGPYTPASSSQGGNPAKRPRLDPSASGAPSYQLDSLTLFSNPPSPKPQPVPQVQLTRPWKSVYCERLAIAKNWQRGKCKFRVLQGHTDAVTCLQIDETLTNPSYPVLMTGSWDRTIRIWNADTGKCVNVLKGHTRGVRCIQFDSVKLISGSMDNSLKIWSWRTGQCIRTLEGHRDAVISLCFDKHVLASGSADATIRIWDFNTGECFTLRGHREWVNQVKMWSPESNDCSATPAEPSGELITNGSNSALRPSPNNGSTPSVKLLFSTSDDGTLKVWDLLTRQCVRTLEGHVAQVQCLKVLSINEAGGGSGPSSLDNDQNSYINASEASNGHGSSNGNGSASQHRSQVTNGNGYEGFFDQQPGHGGSIMPPPGFVTAGQLPQAHPDPSAYLAAAARAPPDPSTLPFLDFGNGPAPLVITGSLDNTIKMWNIDEASCARTLFGHIEGVWAVDMDKLRIVSASHDRTIKIWDRVSGRCLHTLVGHRGAVTSVALGDDKIISGSDDSTVRIWSFAA